MQKHRKGVKSKGKNVCKSTLSPVKYLYKVRLGLSEITTSNPFVIILPTIMIKILTKKVQSSG